MKSHLVGAEFHADVERDGQTDMMKAVVAFRNFANAPKHSQRRQDMIKQTDISYYFCTLIA
jgi:hypothetical protein